LWFIGIDIGAAFSKGVLLEDDKLYAYYVVPSGFNYRETAERIKEELRTRANLSEENSVAIGATGWGAENVYFATYKLSDYICTARGISSIFPSARTGIDVAGQCMKVIRLNERGSITNFIASEKCAAGSGRFIQVIANVLRVNLEDFGPLSLQSQNPVTFSTQCAVFGETEAITRVAEGFSKEDIAAGANNALAGKAYSLVSRIKLEEPCAICGGGALNSGLVRSIEERLNVRLLVPEQPQIVSALGAALIARKSYQ